MLRPPTWLDRNALVNAVRTTESEPPTRRLGDRPNWLLRRVQRGTDEV